METKQWVMEWEKENRRWFGVKEWSSVLAYAASMMLTGVPAVGESVLEEVYGVVRKSLGRIGV